MITEGLDNALEVVLHSTIHDGQSLVLSKEEPKTGKNEIIAQKKKELIALVHAEAINLADRIIGKDIILHNFTDTDGTTFLNPSEKAIYDKQVQQRIELAKYQNEPQVGPSGPVQINDELSENEA